jgi:hypothetical protein
MIAKYLAMSLAIENVVIEPRVSVTRWRCQQIFLKAT